MKKSGFTDEQIAFALKQAETGTGIGNRPLEPRALEVEFFPMEEVLHEKVKIH